MAKRLKTVFGSHAQVAHIWAQQTQPSGRTKAMFFEGDSIYSYGYHYKISKIHTRKGKSFALVNSRGYSNSTSKHTSRTINALSGLMPYFYSPNTESVIEAVKRYDSIAKASIPDALRRLKITSRDSVNWGMERIRDAYKEANQLRVFLGKAKLKPKAKDLAKAKAHFEARLKRYHELNTPEMVAKRAEEAAKRAVRKAKAEEAREAEKITKFRAGEQVSLYNLKYELLRVKGDTVETSRGAQVPVREAQLLYKAVVAGKKIKGLKVGSFTLISVTDIGTDKVVKIGCHEILLSEARGVLDPTPMLNNDMRDNDANTYHTKLQLIKGGAA